MNDLTLFDRSRKRRLAWRRPMVLFIGGALAGFAAPAIQAQDGEPDSGGIELVSAIAPVTPHTADYLTGLTAARSDLLLRTLPNAADRTDRLRGVINLVSSPQPFMESLPDLVAGKQVPVAASLRAYDKLVGNQQNSTFDAWIKGTFAVLGSSNTLGQVGAVAVGVDQLLTEDLLLGGFAQRDASLRGTLGDPDLLRGGWTLGGYGTWRLSENLFIDALAGHGQSSGIANPHGHGGDGFGSQSWLATAAVSGKWTADKWTFTPQARLRYFDETAFTYAALDGAGRAVETGGELTIGQGVSYRLTTDNKIAVDTGLTLEAATALTGDALSGRIEGTVGLNLPAGPQWKSSMGLGGLGTDDPRFTARSSLTAPLR